MRLISFYDDCPQVWHPSTNRRGCRLREQTAGIAGALHNPEKYNYIVIVLTDLHPNLPTLRSPGRRNFLKRI
jgi:hypothetical protein